MADEIFIKSSNCICYKITITFDFNDIIYKVTSKSISAMKQETCISKNVIIISI